MEVRTKSYETFLDDVLSGNEEWAVVSSINFEECSIRIVMDLLSKVDRSVIQRLHFFPFRLVSQRASPWSALELVKTDFQEKVEKQAACAGVSFRVKITESPVEEWAAHEILTGARGPAIAARGLILDISALPRELAVFLCDMVCGVNERFVCPAFSHIVIVQTPPERITSRQGLGPFSVGDPKCVYRGHLLYDRGTDLKTSLLLFPGYEGFEASSVVDSVSGHNAMILVAVGCFEPSFPKAMNLLIANQSLLADAVDGSLDLGFYFSEHDALRLALNWVDRALRLCQEYKDNRHAFITAPFGPKWSVLLSAIARSEFQRQSQSLGISPDRILTDVLVLPRSQYVSLYSRGMRTPCVFKLDRS